MKSTRGPGSLSPPLPYPLPALLSGGGRVRRCCGARARCGSGRAALQGAAVRRGGRAWQWCAGRDWVQRRGRSPSLQAGARHDGGQARPAWLREQRLDAVAGPHPPALPLQAGPGTAAAKRSRRGFGAAAARTAVDPPEQRPPTAPLAPAPSRGHATSSLPRARPSLPRAPPYRAHGGPRRRRRLRRRREIRPHVSLPSVPGAVVRAHPRSVPGAAPSTPATPIRPGTSRRTCRRRWTRRRSTPPAAPSARRATPPAGRTRAARLPPFRRTASRLLPAAAGQHAPLPSGAPHRDFSLRLLVRRPFSLVSLPRFSLILLPPVLSQAGSTLLWPRNRRQLARDEFAPLSTN